MPERPRVVDAERSTSGNGRGLLAPVARALRNAAAGPRAAEVDDADDRILRYGIALSAVGLVAQSLLHVVDAVVFDRGVDSLDVDEDYGVGSWASVAATFGAAVGAGLLAIIRRHRLFAALAVLFAFLSFDDFMRVHERVGEAGELFGLDPDLELGRVIWPALLFPVLGLGGTLLWLAAKEFDRRTERIVRAGLALLALAVVLEAGSAALFHLDYEHSSWPYELEVLLEEGAEFVGWTWIATALLAAACGTLVEAARRR